MAKAAHFSSAVKAAHDAVTEAMAAASKASTPAPGAVQQHMRAALQHLNIALKWAKIHASLVKEETHANPAESAVKPEVHRGHGVGQPPSK